MHTNCISSLGINIRFLFTTSVIITKGAVKIRQVALTSLELKFSVGMLHNIAHRQLMVLLVLLMANHDKTMPIANEANNMDAVCQYERSVMCSSLTDLLPWLCSDHTRSGRHCESTHVLPVKTVCVYEMY